MAIPTDSFVKVQSADTPTKEITSIRKQPNVSYHTIGAIVADVVAAANVSATGDFDTVASMKAGTLAHNDIARTKGYTTVGDGGSCVYKITEDDPAGVEHVITLNNGKYATAQYHGAVDPVQWGAIVNDDTKAAGNVTALNNMFKYLAVHSGTSASPACCSFSPGVYYINATVNLPQPIYSGSSITTAATGFYAFYFNNSVIKATASATYPMLHREIGNETSNGTGVGGSFSPSNSVDTTFSMYDLTIDGGSIGGSWGTNGIGMHIEATYSTDLNNINIKNCNQGLRLDFCLHANVKGGLYNNCKRSIYLSHGDGLDWATTNDTNQCNRSRIDMCRIYSHASSEEQVWVEHAGGVEIANCIFEGSSPTNALVYADLTGNTVVDFYVDNCHVESSLASDGSGGYVDQDANFAAFKLVGSSSRAYISRVYSQAQTNGAEADRRILVDASNFTGVVAYNTVYFNTYDQFKGLSNNGVKWIFSGELPEEVCRPSSASTYWVSGNDPTNAFIQLEGGGDNKVGWIETMGSWAAKGATAGIYGRASDGATGGYALAGDNYIKLSGGKIQLEPTNDIQLDAVKINWYDSVDGIDTRIMRPADNTGVVQVHLPTANNSYITGYTGTTAPAQNGPGKKGEIRYSGSKVYLCIGTNTWVRMNAETSW